MEENEMRADGSDRSEKTKNAERSPLQSLKELMNSDYAKKRFMEVMGEKEKSTAFIASVLNAAQRNPDLARCEPQSILGAAMTAATLDLPIDSNLGFSAIVPYNTKRKDAQGKEYWVSLAQFQIMYKGFIQLALRSGQYKTINVSPIYEDEFESYDIISGNIIVHPVAAGYREQDNQEKIIGYVAFFRLLNGYERIEYWSLKKIEAHGQRHSKSYDNKHGLWKKDPHAMYAKTVLKNTLSKWGILSVTMQTAMVTDQAVIRRLDGPIDGDNVDYIDAKGTEVPSEPTEDETSASAAKEESGAESEAAANQQPEKATTEEKPAPSPQMPHAKGNPEKKGDGLFTDEEASALEEQYQRSQNIPKFD
jgi:recombination protein RecT